jgi:primosomal protein N' (replication factor Y)
MKKERGTFSKELVQKIFTYQKSGYQSILFINRRGFSPVIQCTKCGYRFQCPNCSVSLTYHKKDNLFSCHYCGYEVLNPGQCAQCGESELIMTGSGTQRLEEEIQGIFHQFKIIRMDRDSTSKKGSHDQFLGDFRDGKADILVGTQMIAKGLDFEKVRIVGVVSADITLNLPDFRSGENAFSLLTQVAGRSGRKMPGEVVIQTFAPDHYVMQKVKQQDYEGFYNKEIEVRKNFGYPPFVRIVRLVIRGIQQEKVEKTAGKLAMDLKGKGVSFFGPAPCPLEKINKNFRYHLFIKTGKVIPLVKILKKTLETYQKISGIYIELDVDPVSML